MDTEKLNKIKDYYNNTLTIIGFNDLEEVLFNGSFFKSILLDKLSSVFENGEIDATIIDMFSPIMNKTEHIDYFLKSNLSIEEIKLARVYANVLYLENLAKKYHLPKVLGKIGYLSKLNNKIDDETDKRHIVSILEEAKEPIIIYSSGYSNLKREIAYDGVSNLKDYNYTLRKSTSRKLLSDVIYGIEKNIYNILSINDTSDIYLLNASIPNTPIKEVSNLVISFNEALLNVCAKYHLTYIDKNKVGDISSLVNAIIDAIYKNKFIAPKIQTREYSDFNYNSKGAFGVMDKTLSAWREIQKQAMAKEGFEKEHLLSIASTHIDEYNVFSKVEKTLKKKL